jgi:hypothetical protein
MKGLKHFFLRECKDHNVSVSIGPKWYCSFRENKTKIVVPPQTSDLNLFFGFHELGHALLHRKDSRDYDNLQERIEMELEADTFAANMFRKYDLGTPPINNATLGLIVLLLLEGSEMKGYSVTIKNERFVILKKFGFELFSQFISNLPMHPVIN